MLNMWVGQTRIDSWPKKIHYGSRTLVIWSISKQDKKVEFVN